MMNVLCSRKACLYTPNSTWARCRARNTARANRQMNPTVRPATRTRALRLKLDSTLSTRASLEGLAQDFHDPDRGLPIPQRRESVTGRRGVAAPQDPRGQAGEGAGR